MIYNTEIDKIDKIIINNFDKVSPISCKMLINKDKNKNFEEINNEQIFEKERNPIEKSMHLKRKNNELKYKSLTKIEKNIKKRNNFSLPIVLAKSNKIIEKNFDDKNLCAKETMNIFSINNKSLK